MSSKVSYIDYLKLFVTDPLDEDRIRDLSLIESKGGLENMQIVPNPAKVDVPPNMVQGYDEAGMRLANGLYRQFNYNRYVKRIKRQPDVKRLLIEGDSWCQFPLLLKEISDQLSVGYAVRNIGAAGDTAENMLGPILDRKKNEIGAELEQMGEEVDAVIFSGAGNDIIGERQKEDSDETVSALYDILIDYDKDLPVSSHINERILEQRLKQLRFYYLKLIEVVREIAPPKTPILIHGYDYVYPYPFPKDGDIEDKRTPPFFYKNDDEWLGQPLKRRKIPLDFGREIIQLLIDRLHDKLLYPLAQEDPDVVVVNCRGTLSNVNEWFDEIHPRNLGFAAIANKFQDELITRNILPS